MMIKTSETSVEEATLIPTRFGGTRGEKTYDKKASVTYNKPIRNIFATARRDRVTLSAALKMSSRYYEAYETETRIVFVPVAEDNISSNSMQLISQNGYKESTMSFTNMNLAMHLRRIAGITEKNDRSLVRFRAYTQDGNVYLEKDTIEVIKR